MKRKGYLTPQEIVNLGFQALVEKLGPGGAARFMLQFDAGSGDYTTERKTILKGVTLRKLQSALRGR